MSHTRGGWYNECVEHPRPAEPPLPVDESPAWCAVDEWERTHFLVGNEGITTCEENRFFDICLECTEARQERLEDDQVYVPWHGSRSVRGSGGQFVTQSPEADLVSV